MGCSATCYLERIGNPRLAWTGTKADGSTAQLHCTSWTVLVDVGYAGNVALKNMQWTYSCTPNCSSMHRLYCIESPLP